jgi:hypothetical protein
MCDGHCCAVYQRVKPCNEPISGAVCERLKERTLPDSFSGHVRLRVPSCFATVGEVRQTLANPN